MYNIVHLRHSDNNERCITNNNIILYIHIPNCLGAINDNGCVLVCGEFP